MNYRWFQAPAQPLLAQALAKGSGVSLLLAQCLINRGYSNPDSLQRYLAPRLKQLEDPFRLPDMTAAVNRLFEAHERSEPVVIFGDYDVDGVTSTALLTEVLGGLGWKIQSFLPHRLEEGYGLSREAMEKCLHQHPCRLVLAVDCGSTAVDTIHWLHQQSIDVLVLDHHQVSEPRPPAVALINPWAAATVAEGSAAGLVEESGELCSVGLAFKLAHAVVKRARECHWPKAEACDLRESLDLVALGTIADLVPLTAENRILVSAGLEHLNQTRRPGLIALKQVAQVPEPVQVHQVAFQLAPRLNAAGRLEDAETALRLLLTRDPTEARTYALELDSRNRERQKIEQSMTDDVVGAVRARFNPKTDYVIIEGHLLWHIGVVGIVASRVLRQFHRPTIILGGEGQTWRGSGRSIEGFDLAAGLRTCQDLLLRHGGHAMAAGLTIAPDNLDPLRTRLNDLARRLLKPDDLEPKLRLDASVALSDLNFELLAELGQIEPVGQGNLAVQLAAENLALARPPQRLGKDQQHVKFWVTDGACTLEALWWGGGQATWPSGRFDLAFVPKINLFNGRRTLQLNVLHWRPSAQPGRSPEA